MQILKVCFVPVALSVFPSDSEDGRGLFLGGFDNTCMEHGLTAAPCIAHTVSPGPLCWLETVLKSVSTTVLGKCHGSLSVVRFCCSCFILHFSPEEKT